MLCLFAPADKREALFALYAFNHEISRTRDVVTDTNLGLIRLQWWRDGIANGVISGAPVLDAVINAIRAHNLPREKFESLIYAHEFDLEDRQPAGMDGFLKYAEFVSVPLIELGCAIMGEPPRADIAVGCALVSLLRATPGHLRAGRCMLPVVNVEPFYAGQELDRLKPLVRDIAAVAREKLSDLPGKFVGLQGALACMYLKKIEKLGHDLFSPAFFVSPLLRELRLAARYLLT